MELKFLPGFFRQSDPIIGHGHPVMGLAKLWIRLDCLGIEMNRLFRLVLREIHSKTPRRHRKLTEETDGSNTAIQIKHSRGSPTLTSGEFY